MSDFGLKIVNDSGDIQIDSTYQNYFKFCAASFIIPHVEGLIAHALTTGANFEATLPSTPPIVAIRPSLKTAFQLRTVYSTSPAPPYFLLDGWYGFQGVHSNSDVLEASRTAGYIAYTKYSPTVPTDDYGLVVKNSYNEICFSSEESYFKIKGVYPISTTFTASNISGDHEDITVSNADTNYYMLNDIYTQVAGDPPTYKNRAVGIRKLNSSTIRVEFFNPGIYFNASSVATYFGSPTLLTEVGI